jgi:DNA-binding transcriptional MerR regulator
MKIGELCERSGVPLSSVKFYLREGLLPAGVATARNQADYGESHLERLALIRALREVGRLPLEQVARVTAELDRARAEGWKSRADPIGLALRALHAAPARERSAGERRELARLRKEVAALLEALPWVLGDEARPFADEIAETLLDVRRYLYPDYPVGKLAAYARAAWRLSELEFAEAPGGARVPLRARGDDIAEPTRRAILSSFLFDRIFGALRRCANTMRSIRISEGKPVPPSEPAERQSAGAARSSRRRR